MPENKNNHPKVISILGAGWLGLPLGRFLIEKGFRVKGSTRSQRKLAQIAADGLQPFLLNIDEAIEGPATEAFFQSDVLILDIPPGRRQADVTERFPRQVRLAAEQALTAGIGRMIFISSTGIYGDENRILTEDDRPLPDRPAGKALLLAEDYLKELPGLQLTTLRLAGLVGGDRKAGRFLAGKTDVANADAPINLVHRDDCIGVIYEVLRQECWGQTFNVCADSHPTRRDFYTAQAKKEGLTPPTFAEESDTSFKIISNEKVKKILGYRFWHPDPESF